MNSYRLRSISGLLNERNNRTVQSSLFMSRKEYGRLCWRRIHQSAGKVRTHEHLIDFNEMMIKLSQEYECSLCRKHITEYLNINGLPSNVNQVLDWTIDFHNIVNRRLGKEIIPNEEARLMWLSL